MDQEKFQFTHPGKGATCLKEIACASASFQFTHPGKGATASHICPLTTHCVSIHAPWEGCDCGLSLRSLHQPCFNSRTLGRVRLDGFSQSGVVNVFQFTHPGKGATSQMLGQPTTGAFQFTHPGKGATSPHYYPNGGQARFNSRTLGRVRRWRSLHTS